MTRPVRLQAARQKARDRRIALEVGREARDRRVEDAAAEVFTRLAERAEAKAAIAAANAAIGQSLVTLASEGLSVEAVAELVELEAAEVRRLSRSACHDATAARRGGRADAEVPAVDGVVDREER